MEFKIGDIITPNDKIDDYARLTTKGKGYIVTDVNNNNRNAQKVRIVFDDGVARYIYSYRFDLVVKAKEMEKVICIDIRDSLILGIRGKNAEYVVQERKNRKVKVLGYWFDDRRFIKAADKVAEEKPKVPTLLEELNRQVWNNAGTCSYAIEFKGGHRRYQVRDACHARIPFPYYEKEKEEKEAVALCLNIEGHAANMRVDEQNNYWYYVDYILNRSPWSSMFIGDKNLDNIKKEGGVYVDVNRGINEIMSAAVALRMGSEFKHILANFYNLSQAGCNENIAWIVSKHFHNTKYGIDGGGHSTLQSSLNFKQYVQTMETGIFPHPGPKYSTAYNQGYVICKSMAEEGVESIDTVFKKSFGGLKFFTKKVLEWGEISIQYSHPNNLVLLTNKLEEYYKKL